MSRLRMAALAAVITFLVVAGSRPAEAQLIGWVTPSVGQSFGGQTTENGTSVALSVAVFEWRSWLGAEVDLAHTVQVTDELAGDTSASTVMLNLIVAPPERRFQPFAVVGAGVIRARACIAGLHHAPDGGPSSGWTRAADCRCGCWSSSRCARTCGTRAW